LNLGTRASRPQLVEKCGQDARVPRKGTALFCPSRLFVTNSSLTNYGRNIASTSEAGIKTIHGMDYIKEEDGALKM